jgi:RimJ/RimL family protein N-acetyltransferase
MNKTLLRPWRSDDVQPLAAIANNRKIWNNLRDQLPSPYTIANAEQWITDCSAQKPVINFAITYNNEVAGSIGCVPKIDVYRKSMEIGYFIGENFWGIGIATDAVSALLKYIENNFDVIRIYAEVFANNKASMKVLQKNGFYLESIRRKATIKNNIVLDDYVWVKLI